MSLSQLDPSNRQADIVSKVKLTEEERKQRKAARMRRCPCQEPRSDCRQQARVYAENREAIAEKNRTYFAKNREAVIENNREYYASNRETVAQKQREYRARRIARLSPRNAVSTTSEIAMPSPRGSASAAAGTSPVHQSRAAQGFARHATLT